MNRRAPLGYRLLAALVVLVERLLGWHTEVRGLEHLPRTGGAVITWAHTSHVDFVVTALAVWRATGRPCRLLAMAELWSMPLLGWIPRAAGAIPVERGSARARVDALRAAEQALVAGDLVLVAPEGTISTSFEVLPMRAGAVRLAQRAGVPLIPSASWGTHRFSTTDHGPHWLAARGVPTSVVFGPPVTGDPGAPVPGDPLAPVPGDPLAPVPGDPGAPVPGDGPTPRAHTAALEDATRTLLHGLQVDYPDGAPHDAWWVPARLGGGAPSHTDVLAAHRSGQPLTDGGLRRRPGGRGRAR